MGLDNLSDISTELEISIIREFADKAVFGGKYEFYVPISAANDFIEHCRSREVAITGIETVKITEEGTSPLMDYIADFSSVVEKDWSTQVCLTYNASKTFLPHIPRDKNLFVTFTLMTREEWKPGRHRMVLPAE
jgi:hypothetical protein